MSIPDNKSKTLDPTRADARLHQDQVTAPLSELDEYRLVDDDQDIRGWQLEDRSGRVIGKIKELMVDTTNERVATVRLDTGAEYAVRDLTIDQGKDVVYLDAPGAERAAAPTTTSSASEVRLPILEERVRIGKRSVDAGGVRVSTHVSETPVDKSVRLREEHVSVERRPVDRDAQGADFASASVEVIEHAEIPVVSKETRVVEEVVIKKDVGERVEAVHESVRKTEVKVEELDSARRPSPKR